MPYYLEKGDLVEKNVDGIVNASNPRLIMVEGVSRAIFHKAGDKEMRAACLKIGQCPLGGAVLTPSFNMTNCKGIIHAVAPIYINGKHKEEKNLRSAYRKCFEIADAEGYQSIAFPLLSGEFNYPLDEAYDVAESEILNYLSTHRDHKVYMVVFKNYPNTLKDAVQESLTRYVLRNYVSVPNVITVSDNSKEAGKKIMEIAAKHGVELDELIFKANFTSEEGKDLLDGAKDFDIHTACAFAMSAHATLDEFNEILAIAHFDAFNKNTISLVTSFFMKDGDYDIYKVNRALFYLGEHPLGL